MAPPCLDYLTFCEGETIITFILVKDTQYHYIEIDTAYQLASQPECRHK